MCGLFKLTLQCAHKTWLFNMLAMQFIFFVMQTVFKLQFNFIHGHNKMQWNVECIRKWLTKLISVASSFFFLSLNFFSIFFFCFLHSRMVFDVCVCCFFFVGLLLLWFSFVSIRFLPILHFNKFIVLLYVMSICRICEREQRWYV